ncbi:MAG: hypothetical protein J0M08_10645 [Bacteroidetes bacterium]|nr:hypothetical protein [Bacteroidota bacterium]
MNNIRRYRRLWPILIGLYQLIKGGYSYFTRDDAQWHHIVSPFVALGFWIVCAWLNNGYSFKGRD